MTMMAFAFRRSSRSSFSKTSWSEKSFTVIARCRAFNVFAHVVSGVSYGDEGQEFTIVLNEPWSEDVLVRERKISGACGTLFHFEMERVHVRSGQSACARRE